MAIENMSKEELKDLMHALAMAKANVENWTYVMHNAHLIERKQLEQTVEQMVSLISPLISSMQMVVEVEALTKLDPYDLI